MDESVVHLVDKLPPWFWMAIISAVLVIGVPLLLWLLFGYILPHWRRDKNGKWYWHSHITESIKQSCKIDTLLTVATDAQKAAHANTESIKTLADTVSDLSLEILKNNIFTLDMPLGERMASAIRYIAGGGNGEVKEYIDTKLRPQNPELYDELERIMRKK